MACSGAWFGPTGTNRPLRCFIRMRIREENCNMILLAMVVCINATIVGGASLLIGDSKPVRFVDRTICRTSVVRG